MGLKAYEVQYDAGFHCGVRSMILANVEEDLIPETEAFKKVLKEEELVGYLLEKKNPSFKFGSYGCIINYVKEVPLDAVMITDLSATELVLLIKENK